MVGIDLIHIFDIDDEIEVSVINLENDIEIILSGIECHGILGLVNNIYTYSIKPDYLRQCCATRIVEDDNEIVVKDTSITINNFDAIDGEGKVLSYKRNTGEIWNFDRDGFIYDNGNKIYNEFSELIYRCTYRYCNWGGNRQWLGYASELTLGKCPNCGHNVIKFKDQESYKISPIPICKIPYVN